MKLLAIFTYVLALFAIGFFTYSRQKSASDFMLGGRSLNYWVTALAAHASDMSSWLFLGLPVFIYSRGPFQAWIALGLVLFMFLNWQFLAPALRVKTEHYGSLTISSFLESRFADTSGFIRVLTALLSLLFYIFYISSGVVGLGVVLSSAFGINYFVGITIGLFVILPYLFAGGYSTLAYVDFFQAVFLCIVIIIVPVVACSHITSPPSLTSFFNQLVPNTEFATMRSIFFTVFGWGIGYFGQLHVITKFMGIRDVNQMKKAKRLGISWQIVTLCATISMGFIATSFFKAPLSDPQTLFPQMVHILFHPFVASLMLCGFLAATVSTMDSQILVLASTLTEDIYVKFFKKSASQKETVLVSRITIILIALIAYLIAVFQIESIYDLVKYAWAGLGASFGPIVLCALFVKRTNKYGAYVGIPLGGLTAALWQFIAPYIPFEIDQMLPSFLISLLGILITSYLTTPKKSHA